MPVARHLLLLSLLSVAIAAPAAEPAADAPAVMSAAECEVWDRELGFAQAIADHDAATFADHVAQGAAFAAESPQPTRGRDAIVAQWAGLVAGKTLALSWYPTRTTIGGEADVAVSSGPALYEDLRPDAPVHYRIGGFHSVWHRDPDGAWRVLFDDGIQPHPATDAEVAAFHAGRQPACPRG